MGHAVFSLLVALGVFAGCLGCWELGRRLGARREAKEGESDGPGMGAVEGAVFGLMGLLLAFSFSGAMSRWDTRRAQIVEETNDIGTAWLRLDLLPAEVQPELRELFRQYLDSRLGTYRKIPDWDAVRAELDHSAALQLEIWRKSVAACGTPEGERARILLLPALNAMIDITTTRTVAAMTHPPEVINAILIVLVLTSALMAGSAMRRAHAVGWAHLICFALAMSVAVYLILDLEYPRQGLIRIDDLDRILVDLRASM